MILLYATPPHSQSVDLARLGKNAKLGLVGLVHYSLTQFEEFTSGKRFREEVREVLVSLHIRYDYLVLVFHHLADKKMTALHMLELRVVLRVVGSVDRCFTVEVKPRWFGFALCEFIVEQAEVYGLLGSF